MNSTNHDLGFLVNVTSPVKPYHMNSEVRGKTGDSGRFGIDSITTQRRATFLDLLIQTVNNASVKVVGANGDIAIKLKNTFPNYCWWLFWCFVACQANKANPLA